MSVCIAAIAVDGSVFAVSDRMLSNTDATYEPKISKKVFQLSESCFAMNAGHDGIQAEIMGMMQSINYATLEINKDCWQFSVKGLVDLYMECYNRAKRKRISDSIFAPYDLDQASFLSRQKEFSEVFIRDLSDQVARFQMPETATIIAGVDKSTGGIQPHIYSI